MKEFLNQPEFPVDRERIRDQVPLFRDYVCNRMSQLLVANAADSTGDRRMQAVRSDTVLTDFYEIQDIHENIHQDSEAVRQAIGHGHIFGVDVPRNKQSRLRLIAKEGVPIIQAYNTPSLNAEDVALTTEEDLLCYQPTFAANGLLYAFSVYDIPHTEIDDDGQIEVFTDDRWLSSVPQGSQRIGLALPNRSYTDQASYFPFLQHSCEVGGTFHNATPQYPIAGDYGLLHLEHGGASLAAAYMHDVVATLETAHR